VEEKIEAEWQIIERTTPDGKRKEWQVSDGEVGCRTTSYDFLSLEEAEEYLNGKTWRSYKVPIQKVALRFYKTTRYKMERR